MTTVATLSAVMRLSAIATIAAGCATANSNTVREASPIEARHTPRPISPNDAVPFHVGRSSDVLSGSEILAADITNGSAYDVLARLRPSLLRPPAARTASPSSRSEAPAVFVAGIFNGGPEALRLIPASAVAELRYLRPMDAQIRYGPDYGGGIILVTLRR